MSGMSGFGPGPLPPAPSLGFFYANNYGLPTNGVSTLRSFALGLATVTALFTTSAHAAAPGWKYVVGTGATPCASLVAANQAYASALGTDATTPNWFPLIVLTNGTCAIKVVPGDGQIDSSITLPPSAKFPTGKTVSLATAAAAFQVALTSRASLAGVLPDVLTLVAFQAVLTSQQIAALNALTSGAVFNYWTAIKGGATIDQSDPTYQSVMASLLSQAKITQQQFTTLTTPASTPCTPAQVSSATCP